MIECPHKGCSGHLDEWCCTACGKIVPLRDLLGRWAVPERVKQEQDERLDMAERGVT